MIIFDIMRIVAALMVFSIHLFIFIPELPRALCDILSNGGYGVSVFFVISGFLIFESISRSKNLKEYYIKRVSRILPSYYAILLVGIIVWDILLNQMPQDTYGLGWLRYFLTLNTWVPSGEYDMWNNLWGLWTISCFAFFYLVVPLLKKLVNNFNKSAVFMVGMLPVTFVFSKVAEKIFASIGASVPNMLAVDNPIYSLNTFAMGICAWYAWKEKRTGDYLKIVAVLITGLIGLNMYNRMLWGLLSALIMVTFIDWEIKNQRAVKLIKVVGRYSFCLYLVHLPVLEIIDYMGINGVMFLALGIMLSVVAAVILYHCVEKPAAALIKKMI